MTTENIPTEKKDWEQPTLISLEVENTESDLIHLVINGIPQPHPTLLS